MENIPQKVFTEKDAAKLDTEHVVIPDGYTDIGPPFHGCCDFKSLVIPHSMKNINTSFLEHYYKLEQITVDASNPYYCDIDGVLFSKDRSVLIYYPPERKGSEYVIPSGVKKIESGAFNDCNNLINIILPDGLEDIGDDVFWSCSKLEKLNIPASVTNIGELAFFNLSSLRSIHVDPACLHYKDVDGVLFTKDQTALIKYPIRKQHADYTVAETVTRIASCAFMGCGHLENIKIPESVSFIDRGAFEDCYNLKGIVLPKNLTELNQWLFNKCVKLKEVTIPEGVTKIGAISEKHHPEGGAFRSCESLETVEIPQSVTEIKSASFIYCYSLKSIRLPAGLKEIEYETFCGCLELAEVFIPEGVTRIDERAFSDCYRLKNINIPDSVTHIGKEAFDRCGLPQGVDYCPRYYGRNRMCENCSYKANCGITIICGENSAALEYAKENGIKFKIR